MAHISQLNVKYDPIVKGFLASWYWRIASNGYVVRTGKKVNGKRVEPNNVRMHRAIWEYVYGEVPDMLDHINRDKTDNRLCNLRPTNGKQNSLNRGGLNCHCVFLRDGSWHWRADVGDKERPDLRYRKVHQTFCHAFKDAQEKKKRFIDERSS